MSVAVIKKFQLIAPSILGLFLKFCRHCGLLFIMGYFLKFLSRCNSPMGIIFILNNLFLMFVSETRSNSVISVLLWTCRILLLSLRFSHTRARWKTTLLRMASHGRPNSERKLVRIISVAVGNKMSANLKIDLLFHGRPRILAPNFCALKDLNENDGLSHPLTTANVIEKYYNVYSGFWSLWLYAFCSVFLHFDNI